MSPAEPPPLLALTPGRLGPGDAGGGASGGEASRLVAAVRAAVDAGLRGVLLREPGLADRAFLDLALRLREVLGADGWLGLHDRPHLAAAARAEGVHLGFRSLGVAAARAVAGPEVALGLSTHAGDDPATWAGADYLFHGPVRDTPSKHGLLEPVGPAGLARACAATDRPVWGLGGLRPEDARAVRTAGARGMAVLGGLLGDARPAAAAAAYRAAWAEAETGGGAGAGGGER